MKNEESQLNTILLDELREEKRITWLTRIALLIFLLVLQLCLMYGQKQNRTFTHSEAGIETLSSGNGHGGFLAPFAGVELNANHLGVNILIQQSTGRLSGYRLYHSLNLSSKQHPCETNQFSPCEPEPIQLNWFSYFQFVRECALSRSLIKTETMISRDRGPDWSAVRYSTLELGSGIELRINFSNRFCWKSNIAAAVYQHIDYIQGMDHEQTAPSLHLGTGILITI